MNQKIFDLIADGDAAIKKEAFLGPALRLGGALLRGAGSVGKTLIRRPMATAGAAFTGMDLADGTKRFSTMNTATRPRF